MKSVKSKKYGAEAKSHEQKAEKFHETKVNYKKESLEQMKGQEGSKGHHFRESDTKGKKHG